MNIMAVKNDVTDKGRMMCMWPVVFLPYVFETVFVMQRDQKRALKPTLICTL